MVVYFAAKSPPIWLFTQNRAFQGTQQTYKELPPVNQENQNEWSGWITFLLAAAGSAVGLGNLWKFPYIAGANGGGAFVLVYLLCILLLGIPIFVAELYIGRASKSDAVNSFVKLDPKNGKLWSITGWLGVGAAFLILSFYSVVGGWVLDFLVKAVSNSFVGQPETEITNMLTALFADYKTCLLYTSPSPRDATLSRMPSSA